MLTFSAVLNMSADHFKKQKEATAREEAKKQEQQTIKLLSDSVHEAQDISKKLVATQKKLDEASQDIKATSRTGDAVLGRTDRVLTQTRRSLMPLTDVIVDAEVAIPLSQKALAPYGERVQRETAPILARFLKEPEPRRRVTTFDERLRVMVGADTLLEGYSYNRLVVWDDSLLMPILAPQERFSLIDTRGPESVARDVLDSKLSIILEFYRGNIVQKLLGPSLRPDADLEMRITKQSVRPNRVMYAPIEGALVVRFEDKAEIRRQSEGFVSIPDLANSTVVISVWSDRSLVLIPTVVIHIGKGYKLLLRTDHCKSDEPATYVCRIPGGVEPQLD